MSAAPSLIDARAVARGVGTYLLERFHLKSQGVALTLVYLCSFGLCERLGEPSRPGLWLVAGVVSFLLIFLVARLADDLDDLEQDLPGHSAADVLARDDRRRALVSGLVLVLATLGLVNAAHLETFVAAAAAALAVGVPFAIKRVLGRRDVWSLAPAFEGAPAVMLAYPYAAWLASGGRGLTFSEVLLVVATFWCAYEVVKFSRKVGEAAVMQPYTLGAPGLRRMILLLFVFALCIHAGLAVAGRWSIAFVAALLAIPVLFGGWAWLGWPTDWDGRSDWRGSALRLGWKGLSYPLVVLVAISLELVFGSGGGA